MSASKTFARFQWVVPRLLARSAQPNYRGPHDEVHSLVPDDVDFLVEHGIACVISANQDVMSGDGRILLERAKILYEHMPVRDFSAPSRPALLRAAELIQRHPATLVFCGYGQGRSGTYIVAWARRHRGLSRFDFEYLSREFGVERPAQSDAIAALED